MNGYIDFCDECGYVKSQCKCKEMKKKALAKDLSKNELIALVLTHAYTTQPANVDPRWKSDIFEAYNNFLDMIEADNNDQA